MPVTPKAPYNFIPLPDRVFFPGWADKISHDIPFSDSCCGTISFDIKAETPIFVRDGHINDDETSSSAKTPDGKYFIPATSIKGEIEKVLRILSFSQMGQVQDSSFGQRDLTRAGRDYRDRMQNIHCGFMCFTQKGIEVADCGIPYRIRIDEIESHFRVQLSRLRNRSAKAKYDILRNNNLHLSFAKDSQASRQDKGGRKIVSISQNGFPGTIVMTGQPNPNKKYDFVFPDKVINRHIITDQLFLAFKTIYSSSEDFTEFREKQLKSGKSIPVFFTLDNEEKPDTIGLSYMHKIPYDWKVSDGIVGVDKDGYEIAPDFEKKRLDLSDCVFGTIRKDTPLKGRVQFGHAISNLAVNVLNEQTFISASPRASFFPFYVKDGKNWNNMERIAGYKRYPSRNTSFTWNIGSEKMKTRARLLDKGAVFHETVHFHNLRPMELGALLSAISFHGNIDKCFHNIGFGKPLGYGKVSIHNIKLNCNGQSDDIIKYMACFEKMMTEFDRKWLSSQQLRELLLMSEGIPAGQESNFEYMPLESFAALKQQSQTLRLFSDQIKRGNFSPKSLIDHKP